MSNAKKILSLLVVALLVLSTACTGNPGNTGTTTTTGDGVIITTTTAPSGDVSTTIGDGTTITGDATDPTGEDVTTTVQQGGNDGGNNTTVTPSNNNNGGGNNTTTVKPVDNNTTGKPVDNKTTVKPVDNKTTVKPVDNNTTGKPVDNKTTVKPVDNNTTGKPVDNNTTVNNPVSNATTTTAYIVETTKRTQRTQGGSSSNSNDFRGKTVYIMSHDNFTGSSDIQKAYLQGINTWANRYGSTVKFTMSNLGYADLQQALSAGDAPDLFYQVERFPEICAVGLVQPIEEYLPANQRVLTQKSIEYGSWRGHVWGMGIAGGGGRTYISYNRELLKANPNIKTPRQYFEEGNWTWDTFRTFAKELKDIGYFVNFHQIATNGSHDIVKVAADGKVTSTLATDAYNIALLQWVYRLKTEDQIFSTDAAKLAMSVHQSDAQPKYGTNGESKIFSQGVYSEFVPYPARDANAAKNGEHISKEQVFSFVVPVGAANPAMSVDLALSILAPWKATVDGYNYCAYEKKVRDTTVNATPILKYPDVYTYFPYNASDPTYGVLFNEPTGQAIAKLKDVHASDCNTYNTNYIK